MSDPISHEVIELTAKDGVRRRLDACCLMVLHGEAECRVEWVSSEEAERLAGEECSARPESTIGSEPRR